MEFLPIIYFIYMFISFYFLILSLILFFRNKKDVFSYPEIKKEYSLSIVVPAYNEEDTIEDTLKHIFNLDYKNIVEVLVVNDGSTDNTLEILKRLLPLYKDKLKILNKKNSGKADSMNKALKFVKGDLVAIIDADSYPARDSLKKIIGYFEDSKVGAVTSTCVPRNANTFLEKLQVIEYKVIAFTRKLLEYIDSIYVATGTLTVYRKQALLDIGGFDTKNLTEDIEATWHLIHNGWKIKMSFTAIVTTTVPNKIKPWYRQRRRWGVGGLQCLNKYKSSFMKKKAMLGYFIIPFFGLGLILGLVGMLIFLYVFLKNLLSKYLILGYRVEAGVSLLTLRDVYITPSILNYFGVILFLLFLFFTLFVLSVMKDNVLKKQNAFHFFYYMTVYLMIYPIVTITAIWHYLRGKQVWR